jgi:hypothetical protein
MAQPAGWTQVGRIARRMAAVALLVALPAQALALSSASVPERARPQYAESRYLTSLLALLDEGISNRIVFDRALRANRSAGEYRRLLDEFRSRQLGFLLKLRALETPPRLIPFHEQLRHAVVTQTAFYTALAGAKMRDPNVSVDWMAGHPALRATSDALQAAFEHIRRLHPAVDHRTEASLESQLSWLDVL